MNITTFIVGATDPGTSFTLSTTFNTLYSLSLTWGEALGSSQLLAVWSENGVLKNSVIDVSKRTIALLKAKDKQIEASNRALEQSGNETKKALESEHLQREKAEKELETLRPKLTEKEKEVTELKPKADTLNKEIEHSGKLIADVNRLKDEIHDKGNENHKLKEQIAELQNVGGELGELLKLLEQANKEKDHLNGLVQERDVKMDGLGNDIKHLVDAMREKEFS